MLILEDKDISYLQWLYNRLKYRYCTDDTILVHLKCIIDKITSSSKINIEQEILDKIISKYYIDFFMDKSEFCGYSEEERCLLRKQILSLCDDIINQKAQEPILN